MDTSGPDSFLARTKDCDVWEWGSRVIARSAEVAEGAVIPETARIWQLAQIREDVTLGENVVVGRGAYIGTGVRIGSNSKIQNGALVYEPADVATGVFIGPAAVLTNDRFPRAVNPDLTQKDADDWDLVGVSIKEGASIGARAVCIAPVTIGPWSMVAAGAVVTSDVPAYALVAGVPARQVGWVGRAGARLKRDDYERSRFTCPITGRVHYEIGARLEEVES